MYMCEHMGPPPACAVMPWGGGGGVRYFKLGVGRCSYDASTVPPGRIVTVALLIVPFFILYAAADPDPLQMGIEYDRNFIHMFLGLPDPDPFVRGMDPDPSIIKQI